MNENINQVIKPMRIWVCIINALSTLTFKFLPVFPSMTPSSLASTIFEVSTSPLPLQSIKSIIFGCPLTVF